jgi:hypothetical protein
MRDRVNENQGICHFPFVIFHFPFGIKVISVRKWKMTLANRKWQIIRAFKKVRRVSFLVAPHCSYILIVGAEPLEPNAAVRSRRLNHSSAGTQVKRDLLRYLPLNGYRKIDTDTSIHRTSFEMG